MNEMEQLKRDAAWGKALWDWLREMLPDAGPCVEFDSEDLMRLAEKHGRAKKVPFNPEIHGFIDAEPGHEIWWWGDDLQPAAGSDLVTREEHEAVKRELEFVLGSASLKVAAEVARARQTEIDQLRAQLAAATQRAEKTAAALREESENLTRVLTSLEEGTLPWWQTKHDDLLAKWVKAEAACAEMRGLVHCAFDASFTNDNTPPGHYLVPREPMLALKQVALGNASSDKCAEMRDALMKCQRTFLTLERLKGYSTEVPPNIVLQSCIAIACALSTDCGKGYIKLDDIDGLLTLLQSIVSAQHNAKGWVERLEAMRGDSARIGQGEPEGD